jgi:hypothetical protein
VKLSLFEIGLNSLVVASLSTIWYNRGPTRGLVMRPAAQMRLAPPHKAVPDIYELEVSQSDVRMIWQRSFF